MNEDKYHGFPSAEAYQAAKQAEADRATLRPYQQEALDEMRKAIENGDLVQYSIPAPIVGRPDRTEQVYGDAEDHKRRQVAIINHSPLGRRNFGKTLYLAHAAHLIAQMHHESRRVFEQPLDTVVIDSLTEFSDHQLDAAMQVIDYSALEQRVLAMDTGTDPGFGWPLYEQRFGRGHRIPTENGNKGIYDTIEWQAPSKPNPRKPKPSARVKRRAASKAARKARRINRG